MKLLEEFATKNDWGVIRLRWPDNRYFLHEKDRHYNALGHKLIAEEIHKQITSFGILPE
jgi:hypothetical protein